MNDFQLCIRLNGVEYESETSYGPRRNRDNLATLDVTVDPEIAWRIYQYVISQATAPIFSCDDPENLRV